MHSTPVRLWRSLTLILSLLTSLCAVGAGSVAAQELSAADKARPLVIASDPWCPYACDPDSDGRQGYMVDLAREIFEAAGMKVEYRIVNFATLKRMAQDGTASAIPGVASSMDGAVLLPTLAQGNSPNAVAVRRGVNFAYTKPDDFAAFRLGVIKDYDYGGVVQDYILANIADHARIEVLSGFGYSHLVQGLRQISAGRLDMLLDDHNVLRWQIRRMGLDPQLTTVRLDDEADLFVGFSQNDPRAPALAKLMADGTRRLRDNGRLLAIMRNYGLEEVAAVLH